jgi:hypothetical protein
MKEEKTSSKRHDEESRQIANDSLLSLKNLE